MKAALRKLVRALPEPFREQAEAAAASVVVDPRHWGSSQPEPRPPRFLDELQELEKKDPNYQLVACMTGMEKSQRSWSGERGLINPELLGKYMKELPSPVYYITGPQAMVKAMHAMLTDMGAADDDNIRIEEFTGY